MVGAPERPAADDGSRVMLPKRIKRPRRDGNLRCPAHLRWVRGFACSVPGCTGAPIEVAHVRIGTDGGMSVKPSDFWVISLCVGHHADQHAHGETSFAIEHRLDLKKLAAEFWQKSPHRRKVA